MKTRSLLSKGFALVLLSVMLYVHLCSALCASGLYSCCNDETEKTEHYSACHHEKGQDKDDDCQKDHLAFFNTIGQYNLDKADVAKIFQPQTEAIFTAFTIELPVKPTIIVFTGYHPPPPKGDVRVFIQSFLI